MVEYTMLDWFLYGSETNAMLSTLGHLTVVGAVGWVVGTYLVPPIYKSLTKPKQTQMSRNMRDVTPTNGGVVNANNYPAVEYVTVDGTAASMGG